MSERHRFEPGDRVEIVRKYSGCVFVGFGRALDGERGTIIREVNQGEEFNDFRVYEVRWDLGRTADFADGYITDISVLDQLSEI